MADYVPVVRAAAVRWWSAGEAAARFTDPAGLDGLVDAAAVVVDLRAERPTADPRHRAALRRAPCPVIGVASDDGAVPVPVDLVLAEGSGDAALLGPDAGAAARALADAAAGSPEAAGVLAQLLRVTPGLPVDDALAVESLAYSLLLGGERFRAWLAGRGPAPVRRPDARPVDVRRDGGVLTVTLDRPAVRNAYDAATRDALVEALAVAAADPSVRVVLRGNGPAFCSGGDLGEFGSAEDLVAAHRVRTGRSAGALVHALRERVEVRVHGPCVGAGVELAAFAGRVVAAPGTTFRLPEVAMGVVPGAGGTVSLPRRVGAARTLLLGLSGVALDAATALRWGLVDVVESAVTAG